jgi:hypothetical protein
MGFRGHLLVQKALMGSRGPLLASEGTYGVQRAPMGFRGHLWDPEGHPKGIQRTHIVSRGCLRYSKDLDSRECL